jgi:hypothetical protein
MTLRSWIRKLFGAGLRTVFNRKPAGGKASRRVRSARPSLELLEDRLVPANFVVCDVSDNVADCHSLRYAVANLAPGANNITFDPSLAGQTIVLNGELMIHQSVNITGPDGSGQLAISGSSNSRVFDILPGISVELTNLTIENGLAQDGNGGAIRNAANLTLVDSTVTGSTAVGETGPLAQTLPNAGSYLPGTGDYQWGTASMQGAGGGIYNAQHATLSVVRSTISNNTSQGGDGGSAKDGKAGGAGGGGAGMGGGIANAGTLVLVNSTVSGNLAQGGNGGNGAMARPLNKSNGWGGGGYGGQGATGIFDDYYIAPIAKSAMNGGYGGLGGGGGGGGYGCGAPAGNQGRLGGTDAGAGGFGGGGGGNGAYSGSGTYGNYIVPGASGGSYGGHGGEGGNTSSGTGGLGRGFSGGGGGGAGLGGGIFSTGALTITSSTVAGNSAAGGSGGSGGSGAGNGTPGQGVAGGLFVFSNTPLGGAPLLSSTIIANNSVGGPGGGLSADAHTRDFVVPITGAVYHLSTLSGTHNLLQDTSGTSGLDPANNLLNVDPLLGTLAYNGGPTQTISIQIGSPAIGQGQTPLTTDQRGVARKASPDIGAYETLFAPTITGQPTPATVTLDASVVTLKDTVLLAGTNQGSGSITFKLYKGSGLLHTEVVVINGDGNYTTPNGYTLSSNVTVAGAYHWDVTYNGDSRNDSASDTNDPNQQVTVLQANPTLKLNATPSAEAIGEGEPLHAQANLADAYNPTGQLTFNLYKVGSNTPVYTETVNVTHGNGIYTTQGNFTNFVGNAQTAYQWDVSYTGDGNNNAASDNGDPAAKVTFAQIPTLVTFLNGGNVYLGYSSTPTVQPTIGADLLDCNNPTGTMTFDLYYLRTNTVVHSETVPVNGNNVYRPIQSHILPSTGTVAGDY